MNHVAELFFGNCHPPHRFGVISLSSPPPNRCKLPTLCLRLFSNFLSPCFLTLSEIALRRASRYVSYLYISVWM